MNRWNVTQWDTRAILTPPDTGLTKVAEAAEDLQQHETIKVMAGGHYAPVPLRYVQYLEKMFPQKKFEYLMQTEGADKWIYLWMNNCGEKPKQDEEPRVIMTPSGKMVNPFDLKLSDIETEDIVHHLARICRFNGGANGHYSVAEHSIKVAGLLPDHLKIWGLLHDAGEPYLGDVRRPLRKRFGQLEAVEKKILQQIAYKFDLVWPIPPEVFLADDEILKWELGELERGQLFGNHYQHAEIMYRKALDYQLRRQKHLMKIMK